MWATNFHNHPTQEAKLWSFLTVVTWLSFYDEESLPLPPTPKAGDPPLVGSPRLLIQYIRNYPPYPESVPPSAIRRRVIPRWHGRLHYITCRWLYSVSPGKILSCFPGFYSEFPDDSQVNFRLWNHSLSALKAWPSRGKNKVSLLKNRKARGAGHAALW
jgi:hypothetical protein